VRPCDGATIHTYSGLSANTQERIRRFEQETKAMLTTSKARSEAERREMDKQRIELEWQQAKHELEKDILEEIADNSIGKCI
jgi:membrane protein involved in colicin uptake